MLDWMERGTVAPSQATIMARAGSKNDTDFMTISGIRTIHLMIPSHHARGLQSTLARRQARHQARQQDRDSQCPAGLSNDAGTAAGGRTCCGHATGEGLVHTVFYGRSRRARAEDPRPAAGPRARRDDLGLLA